jgi:hypothetical protein
MPCSSWNGVNPPGAAGAAAAVDDAAGLDDDASGALHALTTSDASTPTLPTTIRNL